MRTLAELPDCKDHSDRLAVLIDGPLSFFVIIGGVLGNIYCLRVLYRTSINTQMLVSLVAMSIWDMLLLLASLGHHSLWATIDFVGWSNVPWDPYIVAFGGLQECAYLTSTWMLIEVSANRYNAVNNPFKFASQSMKHRRQSYVRIIADTFRRPLVITLLACLLTIPCSFEYDLAPCLVGGQKQFQREDTWLLQSPLYFTIYRTVFLSICKTFAPFAYMIYLTVHMLRSVRQSMNSRATILQEQGRGHLFESDKDKTRSVQRISNMLLGKFLVLRCFPTLAGLVRVLLARDHAPLVSHLGEFLLLLNSATNSFIFVVIKSVFETHRLRRIRQRHREMVARHAEQVLSIGKALAGDKLLLVTVENDENE